jgi:aromatic-amino-acid transaminase
MRAVKAAERILLDTQDTKTYVAAEGDAGFVSLLAQVVLGEEMAADDRFSGLQAPGGTGALRLALALAQRANPRAKVWLGQPSWVNHTGLVRAAGLTPVDYAFFDQTTQTILFDQMMLALEGMQAGDIVLLHASCHNPTGAEFTNDQWRAIGDLVLRKNVLPLIDMAYQGLGRGLDEDAANARVLIARVPEALVCVSCSKNFGLYRDRVGAMWVKGVDGAAALRARANLTLIARSMWSMPPDHGAAVVRLILSSPELKADWQAELAEMRTRLNTIRADLATTLPQLPGVAAQTGMFSLLPVSPENAVTLRNVHGIYMIENGRINIAGLNADNLPRFAAALAPCLP